MKRLKLLFISVAISLIPMLAILLNQDSDYPALNWLTILLCSAFAIGLFAVLMTFKMSSNDDVTYHSEGWVDETEDE
jgi:peptidoglycan/LPS O-acetylase OafA/YrhL